MIRLLATALRGFLRRIRPWLVLLLLPLLVAVLASWDRRLKDGPQLAHLPAGCLWTISAPDFPLFWTQLAQTHAGRAFQESFPMRVHEAELEVRMSTGLRPTPGRWRAWMGPKLSAGYAEGAAGFCAQPGLLLRAADEIARILGVSVEKDGISRYGGYCYAWRNGWIIVSKSYPFVRAAIESPPEETPPLAVNELQLEWRGGHTCQVRVRAEEGLPVSGSVPGSLTTRRDGLTLAKALPDLPILTVSTTKPSDVFRLLDLFWTAIRPCFHDTAPFPTIMGERLAAHLRQAWQWDRLGNGWDRSVAECSLALTGFSRDSVPPIPVLAAIFRPVRSGLITHPFLRLLDSRTSLLYEWNGASGWARSLLGREWTLCLATTPNTWLAASREREMRRIAGNLVESPVHDADLVLCVDWTRAAGEVAALLSQAASLELLPEMNARDAVPWIDAWKRFVEALGVTTLDAWARGAQIEFRGQLCERTEGPP